MLLDWPEQKRHLWTALQDTMHAVATRGVAGQVPRFTLHEGNRFVLVSYDGSRQEVLTKAVEARATIDREELIKGGPELVAKAIRELAGGIGDQMDKDLISLMQSARPEHGGMFGGKDDEEAFQGLMRGLRQMDLSFDEDGKPSIFFMVHPDNVLKLQALNTEERKKAFEGLIEEKRNEWLRRESHRRLVD